MSKVFEVDDICSFLESIIGPHGGVWFQRKKPGNEDSLALFLLASGDPFINDHLVKSPDPTNLN